MPASDNLNLWWGPVSNSCSPWFCSMLMYGRDWGSETIFRKPQTLIPAAEVDPHIKDSVQTLRVFQELLCWLLLIKLRLHHVVPRSFWADQETWLKSRCQLWGRGSFEWSTSDLMAEDSPLSPNLDCGFLMWASYTLLQRAFWSGHRRRVEVAPPDRVFTSSLELFGRRISSFPNKPPWLLRGEFVYRWNVERASWILLRHRIWSHPVLTPREGTNQRRRFGSTIVHRQLQPHLLYKYT